MNDLERIECLLNVIKGQLDEMDYDKREEAKDRIKEIISGTFAIELNGHAIEVTADRFDESDDATYGDVICELDYIFESEHTDIITIPVTKELKENIEKVTQISVLLNLDVA